MSKPRLGILADGALADGRFNGAVAVNMLAPRAGAIGGIVRLLPRCNVVLYPLEPGRGAVDFLYRWTHRQLGLCPDIKDHPEPAQALTAALLLIDFTDRRPDGLDAWIELPAVGWWEGDPFAWEAIQAAMERGWALDRRAA